MDEPVRKRAQAQLEAMFAARIAEEDNLPCLVDPGLYLGSVGAALNKDKLKSLNITHVLTVSRTLQPAHPGEFIYKKIDVLDTPGTRLENYFEECINFIDEAISTGGNVLVHCFEGRSRSVTIVVAYLMKKRRMTREAALSLVISKRSLAGPNYGFMRQLDDFEKLLGLTK